MMKWTIAVGKLTVLAACLIVLFRVWVWLSPDPPSSYLRTDLVAAQESATFITGFATVALVRFDTGDQLEPFSFVEIEANRDDIEGFCYRLYELAIGYDSLWATISQAESAVENGLEVEIDPPRVLAANAIDARHSGDDTSQYDCDRMDLVTAARDNRSRLDELQQTLADNGQWDNHVLHARNVITAFSTRLADWRKAVLEQRLETLEASQRELQSADTADAVNRWLSDAREKLVLEQPSAERSIRRTTGIAELDDQAQLDPRTLPRGDGILEGIKRTLGGGLARESRDVRTSLADAGGYLGTLRLTFATIGIFTQEGRRFLFWRDDEFYIRQDFADAIYGSDFTLDVAQTRSGLFGPRRLEVTVPEPHQLALDRYTTVLVDSEDSEFELQDDVPGTTIDEAMRDDLQLQLDRIEPKALRFAKALLTMQIQSMVRADVDEISIRFDSSDAAARTGNKLLEDLLVRSSEPPSP